MIEILIKNSNGEERLDIKTDSFGFGLQYSIDDIRTPEKSNSNYSKDIVLTGSKNNKKLLGHLYDVNTDFTYFNPNIKVDARIVIDGTEVLSGFMQLRKIDKLNLSDIQSTKVEFKVVIKSESINFISELGEKLLTDLDLSDWTHTFNIAGITGSWNNTWRDGYLYPMTDSGNVPYQTTDFKPAFFHKALLYKIADDANFSLGGSFMNNTIYDTEIIPYNGDIPRVEESDALSREFKVGLTSSASLLTSDKILDDTYKLYTLNSNGYRFDIPDSTTSPFYDNSGTYNGSGSYTWTDSSGTVYNTNGNGWIANKSGKYNFSGNFNFRLRVTNPSTSTIYAHSWEDGQNNITQAPVRFRTRITLHRNNSSTLLVDSISDWYDLPASLSGSSYSDIFVNHVFNFQDIAAQIGHLIQLRINVESDDVAPNRYLYSTSTSNDLFTLITSKVVPLYTLYNIVPLTGSAALNPYYQNQTVRVGGVIDNQTLNPTDYLPKNFKQKDLIIDLIRRYNLYVFPDPNNSKKILLETRDDYYSETTVLDWTNKKDYSSPDNIQFLTELRNKEIYFTYTQDASSTSNGGKYLDNYIKSTSDIYGDKRIQFTNEFTTGEKVVKSPFSPSAMIYRGDIGVVVPGIDSQIPKTKPRVLLYSGLKNSKNIVGDNVNWTFDYIDSVGDDQQTSFSTYPHISHFNDPYDPTVDINFGQIAYSYNPLLNSMTDSNLYTRYWRNYVEQIAEGKLITSYFDLDVVDINIIRDNLNYKIFVLDSYYYINKIIDYNPVINTLTKVELIKIPIGVKFETGKTIQDTTQNPNDIAVLSKGDGQIYSANPLSNSKGDITTITIGDYNTQSKSKTSIILGNNNKIMDSKNAMILGSNNSTINAGLENVAIINSNNKTITRSNEMWIGGVHFINGVVVNSSNLIEGGENELRTNFPLNEQNLIEGGENELRTSFPTSIDNLLDGNV